MPKNVGQCDFFDKNKAGTIYKGNIVMDPEKLRDFEYDYCYVTPSNYESIVDYLCREIGIDKNRIMVAGDLNREYINKMQCEHMKKVLFFDNPEVDCFRFLFKDLIDKSVTNLCLMRDNKIWDVERECTVEKLFVFGGYDIINYYENGFFNYIKRTFCNSKLAIILWDKWDGKCGFRESVPDDITPDRIMNTFDYCITYHMEDARKYGFDYYPQFYPSDNDSDDKSQIENDVFFVGNAKTKNRLELIHNIYRKLYSSGYKCRFYVNGVKPEDRIMNSDIIYDKQLKYEEVVNEIKRTKTILEVCVEGDETSFRLSEAIIYKKKIIVNDRNVLKSKYYTPQNILVFETEDDIDTDWLDMEMVDYNYDGALDTERFIDYLCG